MLTIAIERIQKYSKLTIVAGLLSIAIAGVSAPPASALRATLKVTTNTLETVENLLTPSQWDHHKKSDPKTSDSKSSGLKGSLSLSITPQREDSRSHSRDDSNRKRPAYSHNHRHRHHSQGSSDRAAASNRNRSNPPKPKTVAKTEPSPVRAETPVTVSAPAASSSNSSTSEQADTEATVASDPLPLSMAAIPSTPVKVISNGSNSYRWYVVGGAWYWATAAVLGGAAALSVARRTAIKSAKDLTSIDAEAVGGK